MTVYCIRSCEHAIKSCYKLSFLASVNILNPRLFEIRAKEEEKEKEREDEK